MRILAAAVLLTSSACVLTPPQLPPPRSAVVVHAGFDKTWDAVVDYFADQRMPIRTLERASGFIATDRMHLGSAQAEAWANCEEIFFVPSADSGQFVVVVRPQGDTATTIRVTTEWTVENGSRCASRGVWESEAERTIAARAEGRTPEVRTLESPAPAIPAAPPAPQYSYVRTVRPTPMLDAPHGTHRVVRLRAGTTLVLLGDRDAPWVSVGIGVYRGYVSAQDIEDQR